MPTFSIATQVEQDAQTVFAKFDIQLFKALTPVFPKPKIVQFDGSKKGDKIEIELDFLLFKQNWITHITDDGETKAEYFFIDESSTLPFFLSRWKHIHHVYKKGQKAVIVDEIHFSAGNFFFDLFLYLPLYIQFLARRPKYKAFFNS